MQRLTQDLLVAEVDTVKHAKSHGCGGFIVGLWGAGPIVKWEVGFHSIDYCNKSRVKKETIPWKERRFYPDLLYLMDVEWRCFFLKWRSMAPSSPKPNKRQVASKRLPKTTASEASIKAKKTKKPTAASAGADNLAKKARKRPPRELAYSDIQLDEWRDYEHVETGTLWQIDGRGKSQGHQLDYHGNCVPQILTQLLTRYTKVGDVIVDLFLGSGTSAIEAVNMDRRAIGVELKPELAEYVLQKLDEQGKLYRENTKSSKTNSKKKPRHVDVINGDSGDIKNTSKAIKQSLKTHFDKDLAQFLFLHPPYADIIQFSEREECLSNAPDTDTFLEMWERVCQVAYDALEPGRFAAVVIGDKYAGGELVPLGFYCLDRMNKVGFKTKSIIVKNISGNEKAKGRTSNLWRYRALAGGFYIFKHEYVMVFQKPLK